MVINAHGGAAQDVISSSHAKLECKSSTGSLSSDPGDSDGAQAGGGNADLMQPGLWHVMFT